MDAALHSALISRAVVLGDDDTAAGGEPHKEADEEIDQCSSGAADCRKGCFSDKSSHDDSVDGIIELLKKSAEQYWEKEQEQLCRNGPLGDAGELFFYGSMLWLLCAPDCR